MGLMASRASCILKNCARHRAIHMMRRGVQWTDARGEVLCAMRVATPISTASIAQLIGACGGTMISHIMHARQPVIFSRGHWNVQAPQMSPFFGSAHRCIWRDGSCLIRCSSSSTSGDCPIDRCSWEDDACKVLLGDVQRISDGACADAALAVIKDMGACEEAASRAEYPSGDFTSWETSAHCQSMDCE